MLRSKRSSVSGGFSPGLGQFFPVCVQTRTLPNIQWHPSVVFEYRPLQHFLLWYLALQIVVFSAFWTAISDLSTQTTYVLFEFSAFAHFASQLGTCLQACLPGLLSIFYGSQSCIDCCLISKTILSGALFSFPCFFFIFYFLFFVLYSGNVSPLLLHHDW